MNRSRPPTESTPQLVATVRRHSGNHPSLSPLHLSAQDVAQVLKSSRAINSETEIATKVAVRGGGRSPFAGRANIDNAMVSQLTCGILMPLEWTKVRILSRVFTSNEFTIASNFEYIKEGSTSAVFKPFIDIKPQYRNTMKISTLGKTARDIQEMQANGVRQAFAPTSFQFSVAHLQNVYALFKSAAAAASVEDVKGMHWTLTYWRFHGSITAKSTASGGNSTGLDTSQSSLVLCMLAFSWESTFDDARMDGTAKRFIEEVDEFSKSAGLFNRYKYFNYSLGHQDPISGYGDEMNTACKQ
ncbi:hypothetical protein DSL72_002684 [Monilinia vaccinii-corymbosi]|uniref:Berberine/berberine-like domain-containing protein n=1 Tax=Monilinia vaccinii-corymbosi TaxID=61207 RepID=A0A8A3PDD9_9HELO|nr:hypothetical protein DSL72_002684 [Monilinia vaccinii-corymbosi]